MAEFLQSIDEWLFIFINSGFSNSFLDSVLPIMRDKMTWVPFYIIFAILIFWRFKLQGLIAVLIVGIVVGICDYTSSSIIKPAFDRLRPCNDPGFAEQVNLLINCGSGKSFTSSHATNHFGMAVILTLIFSRIYRWMGPVTIVWAGIVSVSQVYVGVHYPLDIFGGAVLGTLIAYGVWFGYNAALPEKYRVIPDPQQLAKQND